MHFGYRRVSTDSQNTERQLDGVYIDRMFDDHISGVKGDRPGLEALFAALRAGDRVHVHSIDRLARSLAHLQTVVKRVTAAGATIEFHKERLTFGGDDGSPVDSLMLHILGAFAQFERDMIRSRTGEGIARAKQAGKFKGGKPKLSYAQEQDLNRMLDNHVSVTAVAQAFNITRQTVYSYRARHTSRHPGS